MRPKLLNADEIRDKAISDALRKTKAPKIVRHAGQLNWVEIEGHRVYRQDKIYIGEGKDPENDIGWVKCASTDNHLVYRLDPKIFHKPGWLLWCSCGSPAVVSGYEAYKTMNSSNEGAMLVCMSMLKTNRHQDGGM